MMPHLEDHRLWEAPLADTSWLKMEPASRPLLRQRWKVDVTDAQGRRDPFVNLTFRSRRRAERYARKHSCEHRTFTVRPYSRCRCAAEKVGEPWRRTGGYASGSRPVTELPKVPGGPAPGAR